MFIIVARKTKKKKHKILGKTLPKGPGKIYFSQNFNLSNIKFFSSNTILGGNNPFTKVQEVQTLISS